MNAYLDYWNLIDRPFEPVSHAKFYYHSGEHEEALARLNYLVDQETMYFGMLTGEIGCGKSLTRQIFASRINSDQHCLVHFENSVFPSPDLMRRLLGEFGWADLATQAGDSHSLYVLVTKLLRQLSGDYNRHLVLLFDEAQDMSRETLADLKRLKAVIAGKLRWIGPLPRTKKQVESLPEDLAQRVTEHLPGLFSWADSQGCYGVDQEDEWIHAAFQLLHDDGSVNRLLRWKIVSLAFTFPSGTR